MTPETDQRGETALSSPQFVCLIPFAIGDRLSGRSRRARAIASAAEQRGWLCRTGLDACIEYLEALLAEPSQCPRYRIYLESDTNGLLQSKLAEIWRRRTGGRTEGLLQVASQLIKNGGHSRVLRLLRQFAQAGGSYGIYIPDLHAHYGVLDQALPRWAVRLSRWQHDRELRFHRRHAACLFVQSEAFGKAVGDRTVLLPPACEVGNRQQVDGSKEQHQPVYRLVYIGGVSTYYGLTRLVKLLKATPQSIEFHVFTRSLDLDALSSEDRRDLTEVANLHLDQNQQAFDAFVDYGDIGVLAYDDHDYLGMISPVKFWDYMALGLPVVISTAIPELIKINEQHQIGWAITDASSLAATLDSLSREYDQKHRAALAFANQNSWQERLTSVERALT